MRPAQNISKSANAKRNRKKQARADANRRRARVNDKREAAANLNATQATDRPPDIYTVPLFLSSFHIGRTKFYEEANSGRLKTFLHCGRRRITREDSLAWVHASRDAV